MKNYTTHKKILGGAMLINILLISTHLGEFWPFSIFPMFSQAGNPWTRATVERVENPSEEELWQSRTLPELNGKAVGLYRQGVDPIDYANFVGKTTEWNQKRINALRELLGARDLGDQRWMIHRVRGYLAEGDSVVVESTPLFLFTADSTIKNPNLFR
ncbi:MAG: hypothetical protein U5K31_11860 [Balneolaceae bacterium]|nr:hypothetical protein [Balneolaceae bacterium]